MSGMQTAAIQQWQSDFPDSGLWTDVFTVWLCVDKPRLYWKFQSSRNFLVIYTETVNRG